MDRFELPEPRCSVRTIVEQRIPMSPPVGDADLDHAELPRRNRRIPMPPTVQRRAIESRWSNCKVSLFHLGLRSAQH